MHGYLWWRRFLLVVGAISCVGAVATIVVGLSRPLSQSASGEPIVVGRWAPPNTSSDDEKLGERDFQSVWRKQLRRPLVDPPPPETVTEPAPAPAPPPAAFDGRLVGTLYDSDPSHRRGWIQIGSTPSRMVSQGQTLEDVNGRPEVVSIGDRTLVLRIAGRELSLEMQDESDSLFREAGAN